MQLEDLEQIDWKAQTDVVLAEYTGHLVDENERIKEQMLELLDRQDKVGALWERIMLIIHDRHADKNPKNSI